MTIREAYYQNVTGGHNKDYRITWDLDTNTITSTYGPIGGTATTRVNTHRTRISAEATFEGKKSRREHHGYSLIYDRLLEEVEAEAEAETEATKPLPPIRTMEPRDFDQDLREMSQAAALG